ncbi:MAG: PAS domain S-box protein [Chloroflexi bacterium]|nr:PAS domain S-box protein [Chloroflexota bacterium]
MKEPSEQYQSLQIAYEIAMSIGASLDMDEMLKASLRTFLKKLNCVAASVYQVHTAENDEPYRLTPLYHIPRRLERNKTYQAATALIPSSLSQPEKPAFLRTLPLQGQSAEGNFYHILELTNFGLLILVKNKQPIPQEQLQALKPLQDKLATVCNACLVQQTSQVVELYRRAFDNIEDGYYEVDLQGNITFYNKGLSNVLGYPEEELLGLNNRDYTDEDNARKIYEAYNKVYDTGKPTNAFLMETFRKDGAPKIMETSIALMHDENGEPVGFRGIARDVTNFIQERRIAEEKYREILENINDGFYEVDLEGSITFANDQCAHILDYSTDKMMGLNFRDHMTAETADRVFMTFNKVFQTGEPINGFVYPVLTQDGSARFVEVSTALAKDVRNEPIGFRGVLRDVTERIRAEGVLRESEVRYRTILESIEDGYYETNLEGDFTFLNNQLGEVIGYPPQELLGMNYKDYTTPEVAEKVLATFNKVVESGEPVREFVWEAVGQDGRTRHLETYVLPRYDAENNIIGFRGVGRDVTPRIQAEEALAEVLVDQEQIASRLGTVAQVSTAVSTILDPQEMIQAVVDLVKESFNLYHAHIYLLNEAEDTLTLAAGASKIGRQMVAEGRDISLSQEQSLVARAARGRSGVIVNDVRAETGFLPNPHLPQTRAEMAVPMLVGGQVLGVLDIQANTTDRFTQRDVIIQTTLASQIAVALQNTRLFAQVQQRAAELEEATAILQEHEEDLTSLLEFSPEAIGVVNTQTGLFERPNVHAERLYGLPRKELVKVGLAEMSPEFQPDGRPSAEKAMEKIGAALSGEFPVFEWTHCNAAGDEIPCEVRLAGLPGDRNHLVRFSVIDISDRKEAEAQMQLQDMALNSAANSITITDRQGTILWVNDAFSQLTQFSKEDAIGENPRVLKSERQDKSFYKEMWVTILNGDVWRGEIVNRRKDGSLYTEEMTITPVRMTGEEITHFIAMKQDISERIQAAKALETALYESERLYEMSTKLNVTTSVQDILEDVLLPALGKDPSFAALLTVETENGRPLWAEIAADWYKNDRPDTDFSVGTRMYLPNFPGADRWIDNPDEVIMIGNVDADETIDPSIEMMLQMGDFKASVTMPLFTQGKWVGFASISWDAPRQFTEGNRRIYQALAEQTAVIFNNQILFDQTQKRAAELETVTQISSVISDILDENELLQTTVDLINDKFNVYFTGIYLLDKTGSSLSLNSGSGEAGRQMVAQGGAIPLDNPESHIALTVREQKGIIIPDRQAIPGHKPNPLLPNARSQVTVPIFSGETTIGVLDVQCENISRFGKTDLRVMSVLMPQIVTALNNARSFTRSEKAMQELEDITRQLRREGWESYLETSFAEEIGYGYDKKQIIPMKTVRDKDKKSNKKEANGADLLAQPLLVQGTSIGKLTLTEPETLTDDAADIMTAVAERLSAHIENLRLSEQTDQARLQAEKLYQGSAALNTAQTYDEVLTALRNHSIVGHENVVNIGLNYFDQPWTPDNMPKWSLVLTRWGHLPAEALSPQYLLSNFPSVSQVIQADAPTIITNVAKDERLGKNARALYKDHFQAKSAIFIPLVVGMQWVGYIDTVYSKMTEFPEEEIRHLVTLSQQAAVAIQSIRLFAQTQDQLSDLTTIQATTSGLTQAATFDDAVNTLLSQVANAVQLDMASFYLYEEETQTMTRTGMYPAAEPKDISLTISLSDYPLTQAVLDSRKPQAVTGDDPKLQLHARESFQEADITAKATIPITSQRGVFGIVVVSSKKAGHTYSEPDLNLLQTLADQAIIAFERVRLLEETRLRAEREQKLREVATRIRSSSDVDMIMRTAVQEIGQVLGRQTFVYLGSEKDKLAEGEA